ncbi:MAG: archease [Candidatus Binatia bacterium]
MGRWTELEHTADVGLRVEAGDVGDLVATAIRGMFDVIGSANFPAGERRAIEIEAHGETAAERLRDALRAALREFDRDGFFAVEARGADDGQVTRVTAVGGAFDPARHEFRTEIKGVTWHALRVEQRGAIWQADVVFDV